MMTLRSLCFQSNGWIRLMLCAATLFVGAAAGCPETGAPINDPNDNLPDDNDPDDNDPDDNDPDDDDNTPVAVGFLAGLDKDGSGGLWAVDNIEDTVLRIDRTTGKATLVSGKGRGSGPELDAPGKIFREADGRLLVVSEARFVLRVDPISGDRTPLVDLRDPADPFPDGIRALFALADGTLVIAQGDDPEIAQLNVNAASLTGVPFGVPGVLLTVDDMTSAGGSAVLVAGGQAIFRVEVPSGNTTIISNEDQGQGPGFGQLRAVALADDGTIYASDEENSFFGTGDSVVFRVDPSTGDRTIVSGPDRGSGPQLLRPGRELVVFGNDEIAMVDSSLDGLLIINVQTGDRTLLNVQ